MQNIMTVDLTRVRVKNKKTGDITTQDYIKEYDNLFSRVTGFTETTIRKDLEAKGYELVDCIDKATLNVDITDVVVKKYLENKTRAGKYSFNAFDVKDELIKWIQDYFNENATPETKAVIGISGGKDSSVVAALCVEALGKDRVFGVLMPQGEQSDIDVAFKLCKHLDIQHTVINIGDTVKTLYNELQTEKDEMPLTLNSVATFNTPARIRMTTLYAISGIVGGRVANTCNLSEDWVGYATKFGDGAGDFSPLSNLTVKEVKQIGLTLGLPKEFVDKTPIDGLCGQTDEDNLGFTYETLDKYIRGIEEPEKEIKEKIDRMHEMNLHKLNLMPSYNPSII